MKPSAPELVDPVRVEVVEGDGAEVVGGDTQRCEVGVLEVGQVTDGEVVRVRVGDQPVGVQRPAAVIPLAGGSLVLIGFLVWARWDFVFKDPERLPMSRLLNVLLVLYMLVIVTQFAVAGWSKITLDWLLAAVAAGVLVGFAEETLFRGIVLRSLRTDRRPEAWVLVISSVWFGFMHLVNVVNGLSSAGALTQSLFATMAGVMFYLFRRARGLRTVAMAAHGLFDMSKFLPRPTGGLLTIERLLPIVFVGSALIAVIVLIRRDRSVTVTRKGVQAA